MQQLLWLLLAAQHLQHLLQGWAQQLRLACHWQLRCVQPPAAALAMVLQGPC
jgi:hypothetical protein